MQKKRVMPFNEKLNDRVREALAELPDVEEKYMFGGVCYMVNDKMCVGVVGDQLMCRVGEEHLEALQERPGCEQMRMKGRPMKAYVLVSEQGMLTSSDFRFWIDTCLAFNPHAKAADKRKRK
ncbi:TfoX/Sxy family protein [Dyadobacter crusticola]|uniref:TfoX/Sxy family protein n=1 Tax=Dyadobacter crusticola TaxID=292407 RepID=UPI00068B566C|nr:TfoX/Sxy family protein [Dyadobacter crusticola]